MLADANLFRLALQSSSALGTRRSITHVYSHAHTCTKWKKCPDSYFLRRGQFSSTYCWSRDKKICHAMYVQLYIQYLPSPLVGRWSVLRVAPDFTGSLAVTRRAAHFLPGLINVGLTLVGAQSHPACVLRFSRRRESGGLHCW